MGCLSFLQEKEATVGFSLPDTWEEYRTLAELCSRATPCKPDITKSDEGSKKTLSVEGGECCGTPAVPHTDGGHEEGFVDTSTPCCDAAPPLAVLKATNERPKRACRLKRKLGKLVSFGVLYLETTYLLLGIQAS